MKLKFLFTSLFVISLFLVSSTKVFADCEIANWDPNSRNLQVCIGKFTSPAQLRATTANFKCLGNSNNPDFSACRGITDNTASLASTPNDLIRQDPDGTYYTCLTGQTLNRAIGKIEVIFSGGQSCTTASVNTRPSDWNAFTEGMPWQEGSNTTGGSAAECVINGTKGINTALGCISYDATGGGFVKSLLGVIIGLGGGIALLLILYGVFIVTTSTGNPDKLKEGKELITSAIAGLLFIIMSIFLMNLIGIKILALPGLQ